MPGPYHITTIHPDYPVKAITITLDAQSPDHAAVKRAAFIVGANLDGSYMTVYTPGQLLNNTILYRLCQVADGSYTAIKVS